jgi:thioester reductase-like protein
VIAYVKLRLRDNFLQEWNSNLENSPKALNYRLYKQIFEFENYFNILENKNIFTFCKFRTTNTKLPIETANISFANFTQGADIFPLQKKTMQKFIRYGRQLGSFSSK